MKNLIIIMTISFLGNYSIMAQNNPIKKMHQVSDLNFMIGEWEGSSWINTREGRQTSDVKEKVEFRLNENILIVEGLGTKIDSISKESKIVHEAFGVIFLNKENNALTMRAYKEQEETESAIEFLNDKVIQWQMKTPNNGKVKFTVDYSVDQKWTEIGEYSGDGENWMKFMETKLTKIK